MKIIKRYIFLACYLSFVAGFALAQDTEKPVRKIEQTFLQPPESAKPWVFWYWMHAAVSKEGITADLEAMKQVGIGGAYLMPIQDTLSSIPFQPTARQASPEWWALVKFAMQEAKRLDLELGMHVSDGFALAGGPWITPQLSMQKMVWTKQYLKSGTNDVIQLEQPETIEGYYRDVAVFAYPARSRQAFSDTVNIPKVTSSLGTSPQFLGFKSEENKESFRADSTAWVQYQYPSSFTCRSIKIHIGGNNFQALRLILQASDDGEVFRTITRLEPPRHGWQDTQEDYTFSIPEVTSRFFRFVYDKTGTEPGAEDIDAAKWKPNLKLMGIYLSDEPVIHQYEAKNGSIWRVAEATTTAQVSSIDAVPLENILDLTGKMDVDGTLFWDPPPGNWVIVRMGHTSTGQTNATGGGAKGLECDKFNKDAIKLQFDNWFNKAFENTGSALAQEVLKLFHVDSWECGSQNWSFNFKSEFKKRRGYDLTPFLLVMAGVPVNDAATSERVLHDVRTTIAELVNDIFYITLKDLAHKKGCEFSAEAIAPTMVSDGLLHYKNVDLPMGEFWLNSPTHDKPNDMLDAISGGHIYGKNTIQAESFTSVRMNWGEHPGNLKTLGDRNFALGINKMVLHVFTHNPWMNKKPGMTLNGVGLYFQRDQTWFKQSKAWIDYLSRCQALLQLGKPVVDVGVFTGEEIPRRAILPDRLLKTLPGIFGTEKVADEKRRLQNIDQPLRQIPDGVNHSANMADPENWVNALNGYAYDSFNPDALMMMKVEDGRVVLPGGASYKILVIPGNLKMNPANRFGEASVKKMLSLVQEGATIIIDSAYVNSIHSLTKGNGATSMNSPGKGKLIFAPFNQPDFASLALDRDLEIKNAQFGTIGYAHRSVNQDDVYFLSNQADTARDLTLSFRVVGKTPYLLNANCPAGLQHCEWQQEKGRTIVEMTLAAHQSMFVVFAQDSVVLMPKPHYSGMGNIVEKTLDKTWEVKFDTAFGGPVRSVKFKTLSSWTSSEDDAVKYYSGTAKYSTTFNTNPQKLHAAFISIDALHDIATIKVNGVDCGTIWTPPFQINIFKALRKGKNTIEIEVSNTWHNRLIGDHTALAGDKVTWTTAPFRLEGKQLLPAGIVGEVRLQLTYK